MIPLSASLLECGGVISVITPLAAGADPDANGSRKPATQALLILNLKKKKKDSHDAYQDILATHERKSPRKT